MKIENRLTKRLELSDKILSLFITAGFPNLNDTLEIMYTLQTEGVDIIELGIPFSDPIADGPTIQQVNQQALANGMSTEVLFSQIKDMRKTVSVPVLLMGSFNPILQYGVTNFLDKCVMCGVDGLILPDLPSYEYSKSYRELFEDRNLSMIFLITAETSNDRILELDTISGGFLYMVSSPTVTGGSLTLDVKKADYFNRVKSLKLNNKLIVGFGINNKDILNQVLSYADGAIIASEYLRKLKDNTKNPVAITKEFLFSLR
jgi:tryptophan synthase alpha chain